MALTGAVSEGIGLHAAARFLTGERVTLKAYTDSSACRGITNRQGTGRVKHLQIRRLWLQAATRDGRVSVHAVGTKENTADIGTKPLSARRVRLLLNMIGMCSSEGRIGTQEREEEERTQTVRRLSKFLNNKHNMLFALSSVFAQQTQAFPVAAAAQERQPGSTFLETVLVLMVLAIVVMVSVGVNFYVTENRNKKTKKKRSQKEKSSGSEGSSSVVSEEEDSPKEVRRRKRRSERRESQATEEKPKPKEEKPKEEEPQAPEPPRRSSGELRRRPLRVQGQERRARGS